MTEFVTLPSAEKITERLSSVYDDRDMVERFYPRIAQHEGRELLPGGMTIMFAQEIETFVQSGYDSSFRSILFGFVSKWIKALAEDEEFADEAIKSLPPQFRL